MTEPLEPRRLRIRPLALLAIAAPLILAGWVLWQSEGARIWINDVVRYCL